MLISDAAKHTGLTNKAIEYYVEQNLIFPAVLRNGYRDFSADDIERLKKIYVLRKLGIGTEEVMRVLSDETGGALHDMSVKKTLAVSREREKNALLDELSSGKSYHDVAEELKNLERGETITEKLLEAFPGYYGRFFGLHFARFLNELIVSDEQQSAYQEIIAFLDSTPPLDFPKELRDFLDECTKHISTQNIADMLDSVSETYRNPDKFFDENGAILEEYLSYKQSDEYRDSPFCKIQSLFKDWSATSGYYGVFIPAMKRLSSSYAQYYLQMEAANEKLLSRYPEIERHA